MGMIELLNKTIQIHYFVIVKSKNVLLLKGFEDLPSILRSNRKSISKEYLIGYKLKAFSMINEGIA